MVSSKDGLAFWVLGSEMMRPQDALRQVDQLKLPFDAAVVKLFVCFDGVGRSMLEAS